MKCGKLKATKHRGQETYNIEVGSTYVTIWMDGRWARTVHVHNANDEAPLKRHDPDSDTPSSAWLERRGL